MSGDMEIKFNSVRAVVPGEGQEIVGVCPGNRVYEGFADYDELLGDWFIVHDIGGGGRFKLLYWVDKNDLLMALPLL
jgi:hypothetical protein